MENIIHVGDKLDVGGSCTTYLLADSFTYQEKTMMKCDSSLCASCQLFLFPVCMCRVFFLFLYCLSFMVVKELLILKLAPHL